MVIKNKKVVVTGGAGFIGSHIVDALVEEGNHVIVIDNLSTGNIKNIEHHINTQRFEFINGSITNLTLLKEMFRGADYVFHEAAIASVPGSIADPLSNHETNVIGTLNVLLAARDTAVKKVIFASSAAVYGDSPVQPKKEDMIREPLSPYAVAKLASEYYCQVFTSLYGLKTVCLRYFNVYGPRQDPKSEYAAVIPKFIQLVKEGKSPLIFGDGEQTRDFVFVKDVVIANLLAAESVATGIFNIGTGKSITINELVKTIISLSKVHLQPVYTSAAAGDIRFSLASVSKAKTFGYLPKFNLEDGLSRMIANKNGGYLIE
jgi:UDP-glucose 4-epimerase